MNITNLQEKKIAKRHWRNSKNLLLQNQTLIIFFFRSNGLILTKHTTKCSWEKGNQVYAKERPHNFQNVDNSENTLATFRKLISSSRTTRPNSIKIGTMHPWVVGIQTYSEEGSHLFLRGDNNRTAKIDWRKSSLDQLVQFQPNLAQSITVWREVKFLHVKDHSILYKMIMIIFS